MVLWLALVFSGAIFSSLALLYLAPAGMVVFGPVVFASGLIAMLAWGGVALKASPSVRVFFCALSIFCIDLGFQGLGSVSLVVKGFFYFIVFIIGFQEFSRSKVYIGSLGSLFLLYGLFASASVTWAPDPLDVVHTGFALISLSMLTIALSSLSLEDSSKVIGWLSFSIGFGCFISVLLYYMAPGVAIHENVAGVGRTGGIFGSPNSFSAVASLGVIASVAAIVYKFARVISIKVHVFCLAFSFFGLYLTGSRTGMAALLLSLIFAAMVRRPRVAVAMFFSTSILLVALYYSGLLETSLLMLEHGASRTGSGADVRNLTGRIDIWIFSWNAWLDSPWFGYGLGGSRDVLLDGWASQWGSKTNTAHNVLLESLLNFGIVGTFVLLLILFLAIKKLVFIRVESEEEMIGFVKFISVSFLVFIIIQGVTEKSFSGTASISTGMLAVVLALVTLGSRLTKDRFV